MISEDNFFFWYGASKSVELFCYLFVLWNQIGI
jgi:hypothetical protein